MILEILTMLGSKPLRCKRFFRWLDDRNSFSSLRHYHDETGELTKNLRLHAGRTFPTTEKSIFRFLLGDDAEKVVWCPIDRNLQLYASHKDILRLLVDRLGAFWWINILFGERWCVGSMTKHHWTSGVLESTADERRTEKKKEKPQTDAGIFPSSSSSFSSFSSLRLDIVVVRQSNVVIDWERSMQSVSLFFSLLSERNQVMLVISDGIVEWRVRRLSTCHSTPLTSCEVVIESASEEKIFSSSSSTRRTTTVYFLHCLISSHLVDVLRLISHSDSPWRWRKTFCQSNEIKSFHVWFESRLTSISCASTYLSPRWCRWWSLTYSLLFKFFLSVSDDERIFFFKQIRLIRIKKAERGRRLIDRRNRRGEKEKMQKKAGDDWRSVYN